MTKNKIEQKQKQTNKNPTIGYVLFTLQKFKHK